MNKKAVMFVNDIKDINNINEKAVKFVQSLKSKNLFTNATMYLKDDHGKKIKE